MRPRLDGAQWGFSFAHSLILSQSIKDGMTNIPMISKVIIGLTEALIVHSATLNSRSFVDIFVSTPKGNEPLNVAKYAYCSPGYGLWQMI